MLQRRGLILLENSITVKTNAFSDRMYYGQTPILSYKIKYPLILSPEFENTALRLSLLYKAYARQYRTYCRTTLYQMAAEQYHDSVENGYPVREFEAQQDFTVTCQKDCTLSLSFERYEYTGGAHGNTVRRSDSWDLRNGNRITLAQLFPESMDYRTYLIKAIQAEIAEEIAGGENPYFENYEENVANNFHENDFYLTPEGLVIYFQLYEIAPYSSGIREFTIPYSPKGPFRPSC